MSISQYNLCWLSGSKGGLPEKANDTNAFVSDVMQTIHGECVYEQKQDGKVIRARTGQ